MIVANHDQLPRRTSADTEGEVRRIMGKLESSDQVLLIQQLLANSPNGFRPFILLSDALLYRARLPRRITEMVILYMAAKQGVTYEWAEHEPMAIQVGVSPIQIEQLRNGAATAPAFQADELLALSAARHLLDERALPSELWKQLGELWGDEGALDLVFVVGWWGGFVPTCIGALGLSDQDRRPISR